MPSRSQRSSKERNARSSAVQRVADSPLLRGSLVVMVAASAASRAAIASKARGIQRCIWRCASATSGP